VVDSKRELIGALKIDVIIQEVVTSLSSSALFFLISGVLNHQDNGRQLQLEFRSTSKSTAYNKESFFQCSINRITQERLIENKRDGASPGFSWSHCLRMIRRVSKRLI
jgi:hypothetical protein